MSNIKDVLWTPKRWRKIFGSIAGLLLFLLLGVSIVMDGFDAVYHTISIILLLCTTAALFLALK